MSIAHVDDLASSIEEELHEVLLAAGLRGRQARAVAARLGWDGGGGCTLAVAAGAEGYSRERVRQLEARVREHAPRVELRATAAALQALEDAAPVDGARAADLLVGWKLARRPFGVHGLLTAAELGGMEPGVQLLNGVVARTGANGIAPEILLRARRSVVRHGAVRVDELALGLGLQTRVVRNALEVHRAVQWLDEGHSWFVFRARPTRATRTIEKMLTVAPTLPISEIDEGLRRSFRAVTLPRHVVCAVCAAQPSLTVDRARDTASTATSLDPTRTLSPLERRLVALFRDEGPALTFSEVVELGTRMGLSRGSIAPYLTRSPIVKSVARGRYVLRGTPT
jgi:hypothetical protein